jgi:Pyruvate/2-oxoacid:ferredoxin oxidoreductase gamma subunit
MIEIRFHGRGGQGAVVASTILANALYKEGKYAQSFPLFGAERRGAPVQAFLRISDTPIMPRCRVYEPDHIVILSLKLIQPEKKAELSGGSKMPGMGTSGQAAVLSGLKKGGWIIINCSKDPKSFDLKDFRVATVDATAIAANHGLGTPETRPVNTAILGAFAKATGLVSLETILEAIPENVPSKIKDNIAATKEAYENARLSTEQ